MMDSQDTAELFNVDWVAPATTVVVVNRRFEMFGLTFVVYYDTVDTRARVQHVYRVAELSSGDRLFGCAAQDPQTAELQAKTALRTVGEEGYRKIVQDRMIRVAERALEGQHNEPVGRQAFARYAAAATSVF